MADHVVEQQMDEAQQQTDPGAGAVTFAGIALVLALLAYLRAWTGGLLLIVPAVLLAGIGAAMAVRRGPSRLSTAAIWAVVAAVLASFLAVLSSGGTEPAMRVAGTPTPGAQVDVQLRSGTSQTGVNLCVSSLQLEALATTGWTPAPEGITSASGGEETDCPADLQELAPLRAAAHTVRLHEDLPPGTYRITTEVAVGDERRMVATRPFEVTLGD
jgi:hypothetical protein